MLNHKGNEAHIVGTFSDDEVLSNEAFPRRINLGRFGEDFKQSASGGDFGTSLLAGHAKTIAVHRSGADDLHLVKALGRNCKLLLIAQGKQLQRVKSDLPVRMIYLGNAQWNIGVNEYHQPSLSKYSRGCRLPCAPAACGCRPMRAGS